MQYQKKLFLVLSFIGILSTTQCCMVMADEAFTSNASYEVCFSPNGHCTSKIVATLNEAKKQILLQSLIFTSFPIAKALVLAKNRGVDVKILLDRTELENKFSKLEYCQKHNLDVRIDYLPAIAHNKVIVIDEETVVTGSFNFTKAAEEKNTENVLILHDKKLAEKYAHNWQERYKLSATSNEFNKMNLQEKKY